MARPLRIEYRGALYHVTSRGDRQEAIFDDDQDRAAFLKVLGEVISRYRWRCHAYCLMGNHYHLMIETPEANLTKGMRQLNGVFTQWSNRRHKRSGARRKYEEFITEGMGAETIWKDLKGQIYLGDDDFVEQMREKLGERDEDVNIPRVQQRGAVPKLSAIRRHYNNRDEAMRAAASFCRRRWGRAEQRFHPCGYRGRLSSAPGGQKRRFWSSSRSR